MTLEMTREIAGVPSVCLPQSSHESHTARMCMLNEASVQHKRNKRQCCNLLTPLAKDQELKERTMLAFNACHAPYLNTKR